MRSVLWWMYLVLLSTSSEAAGAAEAAVDYIWIEGESAAKQTMTRHGLYDCVVLERRGT